MINGSWPAVSPKTQHGKQAFRQNNGILRNTRIVHRHSKDSMVSPVANWATISRRDLNCQRGIQINRQQGTSFKRKTGYVCCDTQRILFFSKGHHQSKPRMAHFWHLFSWHICLRRHTHFRTDRAYRVYGWKQTRGHACNEGHHHLVPNFQHVCLATLTRQTLGFSP